MPRPSVATTIFVVAVVGAVVGWLSARFLPDEGSAVTVGVSIVVKAFLVRG